MAQVRLEIEPSRHFTGWLAEQNISLAFTTYQSGKLFLVGHRSDGRLSIVERTFNRAMGLAARDETLWLGTLFQIWRFDNALPPGRLHDGHDRLYVPQVAWTTGDLDAHDLIVEDDGRLLFANTRFSCVAALAGAHSFAPCWRPPFISRLAAEDRCHLNGLATEDGRLRYATALSATDIVEGWRDHRRDGGVVMDVEADAVIGRGLSMPHSPRLHEGRLWLLESGRGWLGRLDPEGGRFEEVAFCPGYLRGLAFHGRYALVGLSRPRGNKTFEGLELDEALAARGVKARAGLMVIDLESGDILHWLTLSGVVEELYDVAILPGVRRPMVLGLKTDEICRTITMAPSVPA